MTVEPNSPKWFPPTTCVRLLGMALVIGLTNALFTGAPTAMADGLDDRQTALENEGAAAQSALEFVDSGLARAASDLVIHQGRLPGVQQALLEAQGRVAGAVKEVEALSLRLELAQQDEAEIASQLQNDKAKIAAAKKLVGQIASQAYKSNGVPTDLVLLLGPTESGRLTGSLDLTGHALRSQDAAVTELRQQDAANINSEARSATVKQQVAELKSKSEAALERETRARDAAASKKAEADRLIEETARLSAQLQAAKPGIESQLARVETAKKAVGAEIAERDRKLREAWEAEQRRLAAETAAAIAAAATNQGKPAPPEEPFTPVVGAPSAFGLRHPFSSQVPITSGFGWRATPPGTIDFNGVGGYMHTGIDFGAACGTPVYAAAAGTVFSSGWNSADGGGWRVKLSHGVVQGNSLTTVYYHNSSIAVANGQQVAQGQLIAYTGSTGNSTGCHAHFETWLNGAAADPMNLL